VIFESSDGAWTDGTYEGQGRGFKDILVSFELYKEKAKKPDVTLVRITPEPKIGLFWSKQDRSNPKWKVPLQSSSGRANVHPESHALEGEKREAVWKQAEAAYLLRSNK